MICRRFSLSLVLIGSALTAFAVHSPLHAQSPISWRTEYNKARQEAADKELPLLLHFTTNNCPWCVRLENDTYTDARVSKTMNKRFVPIKIHQAFEPKLVSALRIESFPTIVFAGYDGKILGTIVGFQAADKFNENVERILASVSSPEWMRRDYQLALKSIADQQYPRAIAALQSIIEDGKRRPMQAKAKTKLTELEQQVADRIETARLQAKKGERVQAVATLTKTMEQFAGLTATKKAITLLTELAQQGGNNPAAPEIAGTSKQRVKILLAEATKYFMRKEYPCCLDRCELIITNYGHLPEAQEAAKIASQIKANPLRLQNACDQLSERLGNWYLELAESYLTRNQAQQAIPYLQRIIRAFPDSRHAQSAEIRLNQLQTESMRPVTFKMP